MSRVVGLVLGLGVLGSLGTVPTAMAADTVKAMGQAAIYGGDKSHARDKAVQDDKRARNFELFPRAIGWA